MISFERFASRFDAGERRRSIRPHWVIVPSCIIDSGAHPPAQPVSPRFPATGCGRRGAEGASRMSRVAARSERVVEG
eukprot:scaffold3935_cov113-Pinguiococcus_pyrenoidosus.AAC.2